MAQPANIREFSTIAGLIFEILYKSHPIPKTIAPEPIMEAMGVASTLDVLDSGNVFNQMFSLTVGWLNQEGFTKYYGSHPRENVIAAVFSPSSFGS